MRQLEPLDLSHIAAAKHVACMQAYRALSHNFSIALRLVGLVGEWGPPPTARGGPSLASPNKTPLEADPKLVPFVRRWGPRGESPPLARYPPTKLGLHGIRYGCRLGAEVILWFRCRCSVLCATMPPRANIHIPTIGITKMDIIPSVIPAQLESKGTVFKRI